MEALKRRHGDLDAEVRRVSKDLQRLRRRTREHAGSRRIREPQRSIARALVCMSSGDTASALEYVSGSSKTKWFDASTKEHLEAELRDWWRDTDLETRQTYLVMGETNAVMHNAIVQARRFAVDCTLEAWVDTQNVQKGIHPAPGIVMQEANAVKTRIGVEPTANRTSLRRWLQRWRGRRGVQLRRGHVRERLLVEEMHGKVANFDTRASGKSSRERGGAFGPAGWGAERKQRPFSGREIATVFLGRRGRGRNENSVHFPGAK